MCKTDKFMQNGFDDKEKRVRNETYAQFFKVNLIQRPTEQ